ncbi:MAG TPA: hypothetical protein VNW98_01470, partial [Burkholderiaceae bacterium]|nr:hypothetical protein [Burkholderiaceae bacterium]
MRKDIARIGVETRKLPAKFGSVAIDEGSENSRRRLDMTSISLTNAVRIMYVPNQSRVPLLFHSTGSVLSKTPKKGKN